MSDLARAITEQAAPEYLRDNGVSARTYRMIYKDGNAPWEIGGPQPEVVAIEERGGFKGRILDIGCGLGGNAFFLALHGHDVVAVDFVAEAIQQAKGHRVAGRLQPSFHALDIFAPDVRDLGLFDTILDSATLHGFSDTERRRYAGRLAEIARPGAVLHVLGVGSGETRPGGPRRLSRRVIEEAFAGDAWELRDCREATYHATIFPGGASAVAAELWRC